MKINPIPQPSLQPLSVNYTLDGTTVAQTLSIADVTFDDSDDVTPLKNQIVAYQNAITAIQAITTLDAVSAAAIQDIVGTIVTSNPVA